MKLTAGCAFAALMLALSAVPSFAQGVAQSPPAPNSSQSMPQPPDSLPKGARTLAPGSTGIERMGTVGSARVQPERSPAPSGTETSYRQ